MCGWLRVESFCFERVMQGVSFYRWALPTKHNCQWTSFTHGTAHVMFVREDNMLSHMIHTHIYIYRYMYMYIHICTYKTSHISLYVCMYIYILTFALHMCVYIYTFVYTVVYILRLGVSIYLIWVIEGAGCRRKCNIGFSPGVIR